MSLDKKQQDLIDHNYVLSTGLLTSNTAIGEFYDSAKISIFNTGVPNKIFNVVFVKETTSKPEVLIQKGEQFFESRKLPFRVSFRPGLEKAFIPILIEKGYRENAPETVMILSNLPDEADHNRDLMIKKISDLNGLSHFQKIIEKSYSFPEGSGPYIISKRTLTLPDVEMFVGYSDNEPACCSMLIKTGPVAGVYWVGTIDKFRNMGFGASITLQPAIAGKRKGCEFACLQASAMGKPVYKRIGFENPYNYINYACPTKPE